MLPEAQASRSRVTGDLHPAPTPFCFSEEVNALTELPGASSEKESRRARDEPEKVMRQWERDPMESEREIYRRLSEDSDHTVSDNVSLSEKKMDAARGEVERLEKTEEEDEMKN